MIISNSKVDITLMYSILFQRATELTHMMKYLAMNYKSKKLSLSFVPNPLSEVLKSWSERGGEVWQLFEPIDGFHPNQV